MYVHIINLYCTITSLTNVFVLTNLDKYKYHDKKITGLIIIICNNNIIELLYI